MTKISEELLPCPFCGWQPDTENRPSHGTDIYCANETCGGARIVVSADETERHGEEAIHRWNTRTSPPPSGEAGEPKVRPLEWVDRIVDDEGGGSDVVGSAAQTAYPQQYWTSLHHEEDGKWRLYFGLSIIGRFETEDDAKNAAQSDYETRIRSALLPTIKEPTDGK